MTTATLKRRIIHIDEEKCDGCGLCVPGCAEGALAIVDGKARLVSEKYCDGLGACLGDCPQGAISIEEREAAIFDEQAAMLHVKQLERSVDSQSAGHAAGPDSPPHTERTGCPGSRMIDLRMAPEETNDRHVSSKSELRHWPVKISLVSPDAPYFAGADLLIAADCAPFAFGAFHSDILKGKSVVIGCPKFDDIGGYLARLTAVIARNDIKSVTVAHMEVPCCFSLAQVARQAVSAAGKNIPVEVKVVGVRGGLVEPAF